MVRQKVPGTFWRTDRQIVPGTFWRLPPVVELREASLWRYDSETHARLTALDRADWTVEPGQHWVVLGPNGAGKTSMLRLAGAVERPTRGTARVLGEMLGETDMRVLRERIGLVTARLAEDFDELASAREVVLTGALGVTLLWGRQLDAAAHERARELMLRFGCTAFAERRFSRCSQGERQRVLLARALMNRPRLVLLDEPTAGLDLPGREAFLGALGTLSRDEPEVATVCVVHHVEDVPATTTHALLMREGTIIGAGPVARALTSAALSATFALPLALRFAAGRYSATVAPELDEEPDAHR